VVEEAVAVEVEEAVAVEAVVAVGLSDRRGSDRPPCL
jgi:hypothetical protein